MADACTCARLSCSERSLVLHASDCRSHCHSAVITFVYCNSLCRCLQLCLRRGELHAELAWEAAGDHLQLPPTVLSDAAVKAGLATTLFERLHRAFSSTAAQMLTVQYRMHTDIMDWSSNALYGGRLRAHASVAAHTIADLRVPGAAADDTGDGGDMDGDEPLVLADTAGCGAEEAQEEEGGSYFNDGEAAAVVALVRDLLATGVPPAAVGVITPYSAQRARYVTPRSDYLANLTPLPRIGGGARHCWSADMGNDRRPCDVSVCARLHAAPGARAVCAAPGSHDVRS